VSDRGQALAALWGSAAPRAGAYRLAALALTATAVDVGLDPEHRHLPLCPFHALSGLQCPLCGGLRAVDALAHGRITPALHDNVLVVAAVPIATAVWLLWLATAGTARHRQAWPRAATVAVIVLATCFTIVRNLPFAVALRP
jgi:hypothetical protein